MQFRRRLALSAMVCLLVSNLEDAAAQALITTGRGRQIPVIVTNPSAPNPTFIDVTLPALSNVIGGHGAAWLGSNEALVLDYSGQLVRVSISGASATSQNLPNLPTPFVGVGSIAVSPGNTHVLMSGGDPTVRVAPLPLPVSNAVFTAVALSSGVPQANTKAIAFDCAGRAFIYHGKGVSVLDPPYTSVAFTMNLVTPIGGAIALTPDGQHLLATIQEAASGRVAIFDAPFSAASVGALLTIPAASTVAAVGITPDGSRALVGGLDVTSSTPTPTIFSVAAPFTQNSTVDRIALPASITIRKDGLPGPSFEDVAISADGKIAIFTGQDGGNMEGVPIIHAPFTTAGATVKVLLIPGGRGAGSVRMPPSPCAGATSTGLPCKARTAPFGVGQAGIVVNFVTPWPSTTKYSVVVQPTNAAGYSPISACTYFNVLRKTPTQFQVQHNRCDDGVPVPVDEAVSLDWIACPHQ